MTPTFLRLQRAAVLAIALGSFLAACGGGGGGGESAGGTSPAAPAQFAIGGSVTGLSPGAAVVLRNGNDSVTVTANGSFRFPTPSASGGNYSIAVGSAPAGHACSVTGGSGTVGAGEVNTIAVTCLPFVLAGRDSPLKNPLATAVDAAGNIYVADFAYQQILKVTPDGQVVQFAGQRGVVGRADGPGAQATFHFDSGTALEVDRNGDLLVADTCNGKIRKVSRDGTVSSLAGNSSYACEGRDASPSDGTGTGASFSEVNGLTLDRDGNLYTVQLFYGNPIKKITPQGVVTTVAKWPYGFDTSNPDIPSFSRVAIDGSGNLYAIEYQRNRIWKIVDGTARVFAGQQFGSGADPVDGPPGVATFVSLQALRADGAGNLWVVDGNTIRKVSPAGDVTTVAGKSGAIGYADGQGQAATFGSLQSIAMEGNGTLVAADSVYYTLRRITTSGLASTVEATRPSFGYADGKAAEARFGAARQPAVDAQGNVYVVDPAQHVVRKVAADGTVSLYAGTPGTPGDADGPRASATFNTPSAVTADRDGNLYVADKGAGIGPRVRRISAAGDVTTVGRLPGVVSGTYNYLAVSRDGTIAASATLGNIAVRGADGLFRNLASTASLPVGDSPFGNLHSLQGLAYDSKGNLYVADGAQYVVYRIAPDQKIDIVSGAPGKLAYVDGPAGTSRLMLPQIAWLTIDEDDNLYLSGEASIRKITPAGVTSTLSLPWGSPIVAGLAYGKGILYGTLRNAVMQVPLR